MKSWKEEKLYRPSQSCKILREYAGSDDGYEEVYKYAYKAFTDTVSDVYSKFCNSPDGECSLGTVEYAMEVAVTDAFTDFLRD